MKAVANSVKTNSLVVFFRMFRGIFSFSAYSQPSQCRCCKSCLLIAAIVARFYAQYLSKKLRHGFIERMGGINLLCKKICTIKSPVRFTARLFCPRV